MPQVFHVVRCFSCETFQVHQVKKSNKWKCKLCGEAQSLKKVYAQGSGIECRKYVQDLNLQRRTLDEKKLMTASNINTCDEASDSLNEPVTEVSSVSNSVQQESKWNLFLDAENTVDADDASSENNLDEECCYKTKDISASSTSANFRWSKKKDTKQQNRYCPYRGSEINKSRNATVKSPAINESRLHRETEYEPQSASSFTLPAKQENKIGVYCESSQSSTLSSRPPTLCQLQPWQRKSTATNSSTEIIGIATNPNAPKSLNNTAVNREAGDGNSKWSKFIDTGNAGELSDDDIDDEVGLGGHSGQPQHLSSRCHLGGNTNNIRKFNFGEHTMDSVCSALTSTRSAGAVFSVETDADFDL